MVLIIKKSSELKIARGKPRAIFDRKEFCLFFIRSLTLQQAVGNALAIAVQPEVIIGWGKQIALPDLGIPTIKVKIDTGARISAIQGEINCNCAPPKGCASFSIQG